MGHFKTRSVDQVDSVESVDVQKLTNPIKPRGRKLSFAPVDSDTEPPTTDSEHTGRATNSSAEDSEESDTEKKRKQRRRRRKKKRSGSISSTSRRTRTPSPRPPRPPPPPPRKRSSSIADEGSCSATTKSGTVLGEQILENLVDNVKCLRLSSDMEYLAEQFQLDRNTQEMLASYDAKSLEDFCLMAERDFKELVEQAQQLNRPLPPLQIRKVQVLREWAREMIERSIALPIFPMCGVRSAQDGGMSSTGHLVPVNWKEQFEHDLPILKKRLMDKGDGLSTMSAFIRRFFVMSSPVCGYY